MTNTSKVWTKKLKFRSMKINRNVIGWIQRDPCQNTLQLDSDTLCYHCETREQKPATGYVAAEVGMITPWSHFFCPSRSREPYFMPLLFFPTLRWNSEGLVGTFNLMVNFVAGSWMSNVSDVKFSSLVPMVSHTEVRAPPSPQMDAWCVHPTGERLKEVWHCAQKLLPERVCTLRFIDGEIKEDFVSYICSSIRQEIKVSNSPEREHIHWRAIIGANKEKTVQGDFPCPPRKEYQTLYLEQSGEEMQGVPTGRNPKSLLMERWQGFIYWGRSHKLLPIKQEVSHSPIGGAF